MELLTPQLNTRLIGKLSGVGGFCIDIKASQGFSLGNKATQKNLRAR